MRHINTKLMLKYWMELFNRYDGNKNSNGKTQWPERSDVLPSECRELLGDMFILDISATGSFYRLAGTRLCAMQGRELKNEDFSTAFKGTDQRAADNWARNLGRDDFLVLICSDAENKLGNTLSLETLLLPLSHHGLRNKRALGITVPLTRPNWLGSVPIVHQQIRSVRIVRPWEDGLFNTEANPLLKSRRKFITRTADIAATPANHGSMSAESTDLEEISMASIEQHRTKVPYLRLLQGGKS